MARRLLHRLVRLAMVIVPFAAGLAVLPRLLTVSDPLPSRADAIFVFAGDLPERARCAAELYRRGLAPLVVFSGAGIRPELVAVGRPLSDAAVGALVATAAGVPPAAERVIPLGTSTWEDAGVLRRWMQSAGARSVIAVTSPLHSRRARRSIRLALEPIGAEPSLIACGPRLPIGSAWWFAERPLIAVFTESAKLALYALRYFLPTSLGLSPPPGAPGTTV